MLEPQPPESSTHLSTRDLEIIEEIVQRRLTQNVLPAPQTTASIATHIWLPLGVALIACVGAAWGLASYLLVPSMEADAVHAELVLADTKAGMQIEVVLKAQERTTLLLDELRHNIYQIGQKVGAADLKAQ